MQQTIATSLGLSGPSLRQAGCGDSQRAGPSNAPLATLESAALLNGNKTVAISHNGCLYRLQATKLGKLILTK